MTSRAFHGSKTNSFNSSLTRRRIRKKEVHDFVMQLSPKMLLPLIPCCTQTFFFQTYCMQIFQESLSQQFSTSGRTFIQATAKFLLPSVF